MPHKNAVRQVLFSEVKRDDLKVKMQRNLFSHKKAFLKAMEDFGFTPVQFEKEAMNKDRGCKREFGDILKARMRNIAYPKWKEKRAKEADTRRATAKKRAVKKAAAMAAALAYVEEKAQDRMDLVPSIVADETQEAAVDPNMTELYPSVVEEGTQSERARVASEAMLDLSPSEVEEGIQITQEQRATNVQLMPELQVQGEDAGTATEISGRITVLGPIDSEPGVGQKRSKGPPYSKHQRRKHQKLLAKTS